MTDRHAPQENTSGRSDVTTRKLNKVRNSYYVYLPRGWCERNLSHEHAKVTVREMADGTLSISPASDTVSTKDEITVTLSGDPVEAQIVLTGAYIVGIDRIEVRFPQRPDLSVREYISSWTKNLPGFEVMDESDYGMVISDTSEKQLVGPILRRQFNMTRFMLYALVDCLRAPDTKVIERIRTRDEDVDRYRYLVERMCHIAIIDSAYARKINMRQTDCLHYSAAAKRVERIADHICGAATQLELLSDGTQSTIELVQNTAQLYDDTTAAFFSAQSSDKSDANKADERMAVDVLGQAKEIAHRAAKFELSHEKSLPSDVLLLMHIERIASYCADICEIAINRTIEGMLNPYQTHREGWHGSRQRERS